MAHVESLSDIFDFVYNSECFLFGRSAYVGFYISDALLSYFALWHMTYIGSWMVVLLSEFSTHVCVYWLDLRLSFRFGCKHYIFISYIYFMRHWYHCGNNDFSKKNETPSKILYRSSRAGEEIWILRVNLVIEIVYGLWTPHESYFGSSAQ